MIHMNTHLKTLAREAQTRPLILAIALAAALLFSTMAHADDQDRRWRPHDNHSYHQHGYTVVGVPRGAYRVHHRGEDFWYHGGEWYRRRGRLSIVVAAPIGAFVPVLPPFYSTVWWRGTPYYYADDTYYLWDSRARQYEVVEPPVGIASGGSTVAPQTDEVFIYPKGGQSPAQQDRDRYECYRFGVDQTRYDPTQPGGGVPPASASSKRSDFMRAQAACLEGRGYTVK